MTEGQAGDSPRLLAALDAIAVRTSARGGPRKRSARLAICTNAASSPSGDCVTEASEANRVHQRCLSSETATGSTCTGPGTGVLVEARAGLARRPSR